MISDYSAITNANGYNISVDKGSEVALRFSAVANQIAVLYYQSFQQFQSQMIDSAVGSDLDRIANPLGIFRRGAVPASGFARLISIASQTLSSNCTLTGPNGLVYQVSQPGIYAANSNFAIQSVDVGSATNLATNSLLSWSVGIPPLTQPTSFVSIACTGGANAEDDTTFRNRILFTLQNPPQGDNASDLIRLAQSVDPLVQCAFVYADYNGAGTQLIVLVGYQTTSYIGRDIPHLANDNNLNLALSSPVYNNYTLPNSIYSLPSSSIGQFNYGNALANDTSSIYGQIAVTVANPYATAITTVNNCPNDLAFSLTLPYPIGTQINGTGGGWMNSVTFPNPDGTWIGIGCVYDVPQVTGITGFVNATSTTPSGYQITIAAATGSSANAADGLVASPINGVTKIQWINRSDLLETGWQVITATILYATNNLNNTWTLILDTPLTFGNTAALQTDTFVATGASSYFYSTSEVVVPGSLSLLINGSIVGADNGSGAISGLFGGNSVSGSVNYNTASNSISLTFSSSPPSAGMTIGFSYTIGATDFYSNIGCSVGDFIFPASINAQTYLNNVLQSYSLLGPGEVTSNAGIQALGAARTPSQGSAYNANIGGQFTRNLENNNEVYSATVFYNEISDPSSSSYNSLNPGFPIPSAPPSILIPKNIAFYDKNSA